MTGQVSNDGKYGRNVFKGFEKKAAETEACRKMPQTQRRDLDAVFKFFEIPWYKKILPFLVVCYAVSPLDLFPDFISVLGMVDDFLLVPLGIWLCGKIIPDEVWAKNKNEVQSGVKIKTSYKIFGVLFILLLWAAIVAVILAACGVI